MKPARPDPGKKMRPWWRAGLWFAVLALAVNGCSIFHKPFSSSQPEAGINSLTGQPNGPVTVSGLRSQVMRFADDYAETLAQACDEVSNNTTNVPAKIAALRWKLSGASAAWIDATGENPSLNAVDLVVLATISRMVIEDYGIEKYGDGVLPLLQTQRKLETNAWTLVDGVLKPEQQQELRDLIKKWREQNPHLRYIGATRFRDFAAAIGNAPTPASIKPNSIFSLLYINPMAGLDPTVVAIQQTRQLAEGMMYYAQRAPMLLSWQMQLLTYSIAQQPAAQGLLDDADRLSRSSEIFAQTAQQLPQIINDQRQAAVNQVMTNLDAEEQKIQGLMTQTHATLQAANETAISVNSAIKSLDAFVHYVSPPDTNAVTVVNTNTPSFNILDYGTAANQIGVMAKDVNALLTSVNQSVPELTKLSQQTEQNLNHAVDRAFWRGIVLIVILCVALVPSALLYRVLAHKLTRHRGESPPPKS
jgi:hypothetical protein